MNFYLEMWERAFDFHGRSSRKSFWNAYLINMVIIILFSFILSATIDSDVGVIAVIGSFFSLLALLYVGMSIIPVISMQIRRFHDCGHSAGTWIACCIFSILFIGILIRIKILTQSGTGDNRWGNAMPEEDVFPLQTNPEIIKFQQNTVLKNTLLENDFVDLYITEKEIPPRNKWPINILILSLVSGTVLFLMICLLIIFF